MVGLINVFKILILCLRLVGEVDRNLLCRLALLVVISFCSFHLGDGVSCFKSAQWEDAQEQLQEIINSLSHYIE